MNESFTLNTVEFGLEVCVDLEVFEDNIVEEEETVQLQVTTSDPAIMIVEASSTVIAINNTDGKI